MRPFTLEESIRFVLAAERIRHTIDEQLGEALLAAHRNDSPEDWARVHDRMNVLGEFAGADQIREMFERES